MIRRIFASVTALAVLAACGGGGGGSLPATPAQPIGSSKTGSVRFTFKIPSASTMTKVKRRFYQSQATQGVAIDWTSTNAYAPDYAAAISAACPGTLPAGVISCGPDPVDGGTDYTFQLSIPTGTYPHFTVTTFDQAPSGTSQSFAASANVLAQGQLPAPVVIATGTTNTIPSLTFYGVPTAVSLVPSPSQSHVTTYGGDIAIIGNSPQTFFAQATDADGFVIDSTDSGAPTVTVAEAASDSPQHFMIASTSSPDGYTFTAKDATGNATIDLSATPGGTGLPSYQTTATVVPVQELWSSQSSGSGTPGIYGIPLYPPSYTPSLVLDYANPSLSGCSGQCDWENAAVAPNGSVWVDEVLSGGIYVFSPAANGLVAPSSRTIPITSIQGFTIDSQGRIYVASSSASTISIYNPAGTLLASFSDSNAPFDVAVAPTNVGSGMAGTIWVADSAGVSVYTAYSGATPTLLKHLSTGAPTELAFDPLGNLWIYDSAAASLTDYTIGSAGGASIGQNATSGANVVPPGYGTPFGVTAQGSLWMGAPASYTGMEGFTLSGSAINLGSSLTGIGSSAFSGVFSTMIAP